MSTFILFGKSIEQMKKFAEIKLQFGQIENDNFIFCTNLSKANEIRKIFNKNNQILFFTKDIVSGANEGIWDADIIVDRKEDK